MPEGIVESASTETTPTELTLEQQLEALAKETNESSVKDDTTPAGGDGVPPTDASQSGDAPDPLFAKLDELDKDPAPKPEEGPKLTADQEKILTAVPDVKTAETLYQVAEGYQNFTDALKGGKFQDVDQMIQSFSPEAHEGLLEYLYKANIDGWVERWIAEKEAAKDGKTAPVLKGLGALQTRINQLEQQLKNRSNQEQQQQSNAQFETSVQNYSNHLDGLFDRIEFSANDRPWVLSVIHNRVAADPQVKEAIRNGNPAAVNKIFAGAVREYVQRDKAVSEQKGQTLQKQTQHKPPMQTGATVTSGALPDDIKQVPKGQEDNWLDQQLGRLKAKVSGKR